MIRALIGGVERGQRMDARAASALLERMIADARGQDSIYLPTLFWRSAVERIGRDLLDGGFERFRSLPITRTFFVPAYGNLGNQLSDEDFQRLEASCLGTAERGSKKYDTLRQAIDGQAWAFADYRVVLAGDDSEQQPDLSRVSESKVGAPVEHYEFDGRWFSRPLLNYLLGLVFLKRHVDTSTIRTVMEVGGGYGTLGEILLQAGEYAYVDVDIPPTAAVSTYYLTQLEGAVVETYDRTRELERIPVPPPGTQMVLCPWQLPHLEGNIDLFVNFISFQEMEPPVVRNYLDHVDRLGARFVLLRNLREGKPVRSAEVIDGVQEPIRGSDYDEFLGRYTLVATNTVPFGFRTIDGFHSELRLYERS